MRLRTVAIGCICFFALQINSVTTAQCPTCKANRGGVQQSGMEHGEAKISVQSNVRISIKGDGATSRQRVDAMGESVRAKTPQLNQCYAKAVSSDPTKVGALEVALGFVEKSPKPRVEVRGNKGFDADMAGCVRKALEAIALAKEHRPAAVVVILEFANTRAQGQKAMQERAEPSAEQQVHSNVDGKLETVWSAPEGKVTFKVIADASEPKEALVGVMRILRNTIGAFLDCRRRAAKGGTSPEGATVVNLEWSTRAKNNAQVQSSTLRNEPAVTCIKKVFGRLKLEEAPERGKVTVKIGFAE